MASSKKKQDEKHLKLLREMVALAHNKQCFDCHQRGPTYINMTIGSFVCTACSGLLRGLNPPHRVKSISMASFTPEEMEFIKCHGNDFCRKVWLGLYDNRLGNQSESREESKVKDFMSEKYERKRYYVAPTDAMKEEATRMNESAILSKAPGTRPLKSLLGENAPKLHVGNHQEIQRGSATRASLTIQGDLFAPAKGLVQQTGDDIVGATTAGVQQQESNLFESTQQEGQQSGNDLFAATNALEQSTGNDLFASTNSTGQSTGGGLFASENGSGSIEKSMGMLQLGFPSIAGSEQMSGANVLGQSSSLGLNSEENLFAGQQQPVNDLFGGQPGSNPASTSGIVQSAGSNLFASIGNATQPLGNSLFAPSTVEAQPGGNVGMFASSIDGGKSLGSGLFASTAVGQPVGSASFAQTSGMSGDGLFVSSAYAPNSSGGNLFSQSSDVTRSSAMFAQNADIPQQNPFGSSNVNQNQEHGSQTMFDASGLSTSSALPSATTNFFGGQTSQSSDLFSGQTNEGQTDAFGGLAGGNPFGAGLANTPVQTSMQDGPAVPSGNQGLADMFGSQSTQVLTNSVVQEPKPVSATPPPIRSTPQSPGNQSVQSSKSSGSTAMDLLGDLGGDPFASSGPQTQSSTGGFADFGNFGNTGSQTGGFPPVKPQASQPPAFAQSTPLQPFGSASSTTTTPSQALNGGVAPPAAGGDKYSNLSDLFSMATTTEADSTASTGWNITSTATAPGAGGGGGGLNWNSGGGGGSSTSTGGINWGGDSSAIPSSGGGINWNSSSSAPSVSNTGSGWGGGSVSMGNVNSAATTGMGWGAPATVQSNVANPFGGGTGTSLSTQAPTSMAGASNPFGGSQAGTQQQFGGGGYGNQSGGFGQFGAQQNVAVSSAAPGQFGQFGGMQNGGFGAMTSTGGFGGVQTNTQAGFGQPSQPQQYMAPPAYGQQQQAVGGGFGAIPHSGYGAQSAQQGFRQPAPGYGAQPQQQMQGFPGSGGWGQAPVASSANPFMSTAQQYSMPPKSGTTNPFL